MRGIKVLSMMGAVLLLAGCTRGPLQRIASADRAAVARALEWSGENRLEIEAGIAGTAAAHLPALTYLLRYMPERDLKTLTADFIVENVALACETFGSAPWAQAVPDSIFLNEVLPYANIHERRDNWRRDFLEKFGPVVKGIQTPGAAAVRINEVLWEMLNVEYNTARPKSDQSPYESIDAAMASCTGLSILLIDACRAVGIPARFTGIPMWADLSGNHSWVEIWDQGWHFIGAWEPGPLDETWFEARAAQADPFTQKYAIWAVSYKPTGELFPALWDSTVHYVHAHNVTHRYAGEEIPAGRVRLGIKVFDVAGGKRVAVPVTLKLNDRIIGSGVTRTERHDLNDVLQFTVEAGSRCTAEIGLDGRTVVRPIEIKQNRYQSAMWTVERLRE